KCAPQKSRAATSRRRGSPAISPLSTPIPESVRDRIAAVTPQGLSGGLHARRCLSPLVLGEVLKPPDLAHGRFVVAARDHVADPHLALDQAFEDVVEHFVRR